MRVKKRQLSQCDVKKKPFTELRADLLDKVREREAPSISPRPVV